MPSSQLHTIQNFLPAVIKELPSVGMVVEYYVLDPSTEKMVRKHIKLNRLMKRYTLKRQRVVAAQQVADSLNAKLRGGWSPLFATEDARSGSVAFSEVCISFNACVVRFASPLILKSSFVITL